MSETQSIVVEKVLPHTPEKIWRTLTQSALIARWLMPNDFEATVGHRFTFTTKPMGDWDGVVHCEVLECDPPRLLRYSWKGGSDANPKYGSKLDTDRNLDAHARGWRHARSHGAFRFPAAGKPVRMGRDEPRLGTRAGW